MVLQGHARKHIVLNYLILILSPKNPKTHSSFLILFITLHMVGHQCVGA